MYRIFRYSLVLVFLALLALGAAESATAKNGQIENVLIFDGTGAPPYVGSLAWQGDRITSVTPVASSAVKPTAFVMPGLIDAHTHMLRAGSCGRDEGIAWDNLAQIPMNFDVALAHGNTTVVDLGGPTRGSVAYRDRSRDGKYAMPRTFVAGGLITARNGYPLDWAPRDLVEDMEIAFEAGNPEEGRRAVRALHAARVDLVKIAIMELSYNEKPLPALDVPTIQAIVAEAHRLGLRVFAHAHSNEGYRRALEGGVDVIAHSTFERLPDEIIAKVVEQKVIVIPTLWVFAAFDHANTHPELLGELQPQLRPGIFDALADFHGRAQGREDLPDDFLPGLKRARLHFAMTNARENLKRLFEAGARLGFGTDTSFCYALHGSAAHEAASMIEAGLPPAQALRAATLGSAEALGKSDLGVLRAGAKADFIVLADNPLEDPKALQTPTTVVLGGKVVHAADAPVYAQSGFVRTLETIATLVRAIYVK